jgi:hypothetical protein
MRLFRSKPILIIGIPSLPLKEYEDMVKQIGMIKIRGVKILPIKTFAKETSFSFFSECNRTTDVDVLFEEIERLKVFTGLDQFN